MKSKIFLAFLLFTPPLVLLISTLSFQSGFSPINTKNNGVFFSEYFDVKDLNLINDEKVIAFDDGKWIFGLCVNFPLINVTGAFLYNLMFASISE